MTKSEYRVVWIAFSTVILLCSSCQDDGKMKANPEAIRTWSFDRDPPGGVPEGWKAEETNGRGTPAAWEVVEELSAPSPPNAVAITANVNRGQTFNLLLVEGTAFKDGIIRVKVKANAGYEDQGGGPVWRALDKDNYYIARWNPLENNFRAYYVKDGQREQIAGTVVRSDPGAWHVIEIRQQGSRIEASLDDEARLVVEDGTFTGAGMVGLWVKADGLTAFDDVVVEPR